MVIEDDDEEEKKEEEEKFQEVECGIIIIIIKEMPGC